MYGHLGAYPREVTFEELDSPIPIYPGSDTELPCPDPEALTILGRLLDPDGELVEDTTATVTIVTFEEWAGEIDNDEAPDFEVQTDNSYFSIIVPARRWGALAAFGTCNSAPLVEAQGNAGDVVGVDLVVRCNE
jgi:hypothetical protein